MHCFLIVEHILNGFFKSLRPNAECIDHINSFELCYLILFKILHGIYKDNIYLYQSKLT